MQVFINSRLEAWLRSSYNLSTLSCRRVFSVVGFTGSAVALLIVPLVSGANAATVCFGTALSFVSLHPSGFKANYLDAVSASNSGFISGTRPQPPLISDAPPVPSPTHLNTRPHATSQVPGRSPHASPTPPPCRHPPP